MALADLGQAMLPVNGYLWDTILAIEPTFVTAYAGKRPFYPISDAATGKSQWLDKAYFVYDRMFAFNGNPFYPVKKEHIIYSLKASDIETLQFGSAIYTILDRQDDAAKDVNTWIRANGGSDRYPVYFHSIRVYQTQPRMSSSTENIRNDSSRAKVVTDFVVDMEYHYTKSLEDYL
jgi:hypothetical protein